MMVFLDRLVGQTKLGRGIRGVAEDAPTAALMGIDIDRTISRTFIIGGALGRRGRLPVRHRLRFSNTMGFSPGVKAFAAAVLGGIGNIRGAMLGGLLLGMVEALVPPACRSIGIEWTDVVAFVVLVLVLVVPADRHPRRAPGTGGMSDVRSVKPTEPDVSPLGRDLDNPRQGEHAAMITGCWPAWPAVSCWR